MDGKKKKIETKGGAQQPRVVDSLLSKGLA